MTQASLPNSPGMQLSTSVKQNSYVLTPRTEENSSNSFLIPEFLKAPSLLEHSGAHTCALTTAPRDLGRGGEASGAETQLGERDKTKKC